MAFCSQCGSKTHDSFCGNCGAQTNVASLPTLRENQKSEEKKMETQQNQVPSVGNYIAVQLLGMIPIVGFILMIVWAIGGGNTPIWKCNYARAYWVMVLVLVVILIAFGGLIFGLLGSMF
jgi:hypothetical protein